jgi:hypothetical protein
LTDIRPWLKVGRPAWFVVVVESSGGAAGSVFRSLVVVQGHFDRASTGTAVLLDAVATLAP